MTILSMGHHAFRGQHQRRGTDVAYLYRVFIDAGSHETAWRAKVYRGSECCGEPSGVLLGTELTGDARVRSIAHMVEEAIDDGVGIDP